MLPTTGVHTRRVVIATEGKGHTNFQRFAVSGRFKLTRLGSLQTDPPVAAIV